MNKDNIVSAVTLGGGVIYVNDEETEDFLTTLIDKGILWEFLSSILTEYVKGGKHLSLLEQQNNLDTIAEDIKQLRLVTEHNKNLENEMLNMKDQMGKMMDLISNLSSGVVISNTTNSVTVTSNTPEPSTVEKPVEVKKKMKASPPKIKGGGFAALAQKSSAFNRK